MSTKALKISYRGICKRTETLPNSFSSLCDFVAYWQKIDKEENNFIFTEQTSGKKIINDQIYQHLKSSFKGNIKLIVEFFPKEDNPKTISFNESNRNKFQVNSSEINKKEFSREEPTPMNYFDIKAKFSPFQNNENPYKDPSIQENQLIRQPDGNMNMNINQSQELNNCINEEDQIKESISSVVKEKLKSLEKDILKDIYKSIETQSKIETMSKHNSNKQIHRGITCSNCGIKEIEGIRFKCTNCSNYNLCEKCEEYVEHDSSHIMLKIRVPLTVNLPEKKFIYVNEGLNYKCYNTEFREKVGDSFKSTIKIANNGKDDWYPEFTFKCYKDQSEISGDDFKFSGRISPLNEINIELKFNTKGKAPGKYSSYWQMFNRLSTPIPFGEVTEFIIELY